MALKSIGFQNPYRPGAGHMPPHLAGRKKEFEEFDRLLQQNTILENLVLTGLRGVGKTVLLDSFKPRAIHQGWLWVGTDLSESASVSEALLATRLLADLSVATSSVTVELPSRTMAGFQQPRRRTRTVPLSFDVLSELFNRTPGLVVDKLRAVLEFSASALKASGRQRVIFAYDEAQNLSDNAAKDQYPLSVLLDLFQSIQKKDIPFMLVLTGLPTLFPKLVEARTFAERMFHVVTVDKLSRDESREAILTPIEDSHCPISFDPKSVETIAHESGGYPYFIQFICREVFDVFIQQLQAEQTPGGVPVSAIQRKLDEDFFAGRWARVPNRQRQLLWVIAQSGQPDGEFTIQEIVLSGKSVLSKPFSPSHANQILANLTEQGLVFKNRFGRYSFAVPLLGSFIMRMYASVPPQ